MGVRPEFDAVIVGASLAGCAAARFLGLAGARVALVEKRPDPSAHKVVCTHQIQRSATPAIERLGLGALLAERGAARAHPAAWSPHGGWIEFPDDVAHGWGVTRKTLDPMIRELAAGTPGVELIAGERVTRLRSAADGCAGVETERASGRRRVLSCRLVVGADGRGSMVARLAGIRARVTPNNRFFYFAYWRGLPPTDRARVWFLDPDVAAVFPNEDDVTLIGTVPHRARLAAFRADPEREYVRIASALPGGPRLADGELTSSLVGALRVPNLIRPAARDGVALVGDAALASDPVFGTGCGWAIQSAEWLAERVADPLRDGAGLDVPLRRYRRTILARLGPHHVACSDFATGRRLNLFERAGLRAAAEDPAVCRALEQVASRAASPARLLAPAAFARVALRLRHGGVE